MQPVLEILVNCATRANADKIVAGLQEKHLIAAANVYPEIDSTYFWDGAWQETKEVPVLLKTRESHYDNVVNAIRALHPYETPAIIGRRVDHVNDDYRRWVYETTA